MFGHGTKMLGFFILSIPLFFPLLQKLLDTKPKDNPDETRKKEHGKQEEVDINNPWSELDPNLLGEILSRLCVADQLRFHVVCKNWLHAHPITSVRKPFLWYLRFDYSLFELELRDPSSSVQTISLTKLGIPSPPSYRSVATTLLNHNWLFIFTVRRRLFFWRRKYCNLLFSPFTRKIITLPEFDYPFPFKYFIFTSSTQPDSPDSAFFLLDTCNADKITIISYRYGDKEWTAKEFNIRLTNFKPCPCRAVYLRGSLYIVSPYGQVASYNIVDGEFKFENLFVHELFCLNIRSKRGFRVFELNGDLIMIYYVQYEKKDVTLPGKPCINRYSWLDKDWIPISTLSDKSLFFSENQDQVAIINKDDMRNNGVLSNKIYQFFNDGCLIYSIEKDGELIEFKSINSNLMEEGGSDLPEYKYKCGSIHSGTTEELYWLEPPGVYY